MNLIEAIEIRRSRRKYNPTPLDTAAVEELRQLIALYSEAAKLRMEFVLDNGEAFAGFRKSYGMFVGVCHYIAFIASNNDATSAERLGYYGELLILHATTLGLGSCWVGGSFDRASCPFPLSESERIVCAIVVGNTEQQDSVKERIIRSIVHRKTKSAEEMYDSDTDAPDWFLSGMLAVQKAPSAVNRQPVFFSYKEGKVSAWIDALDELADDSYALDLGIAKCHFELGTQGYTADSDVAGSAWTWGNHAGFVRQ